MKLLSIPALVLVLSALPLTATAADYGVGGGMLAASSPAPQLPSVDGGASAAQDRPDTPDATAPAASPAPAPAPATRPRASGNHHVDKPMHPGKAAAPPEQPSWQSLLPGSIQ